MTRFVQIGHMRYHRNGNVSVDLMMLLRRYFAKRKPSEKQP